MTSIEMLFLTVILVLAAGGGIFSLLAWLKGGSNSAAFDVQRFEAALGKIPADLRAEISLLRQENEQRAADLRQELVLIIKTLSDGLSESLKTSTESLGRSQADKLSETNLIVRQLVETLERQQTEGRKANTDALEKIRETLTLNLESLRKENEGKLEQMRATVEEKLQGTLEQRIGESFKLVSERLEAVHKGLGEMQSLATGVGDLKRVLSNVKARGGWGEVQLGILLEDMLTPDQYEQNAVIQPGRTVEFAVRMPGKNDDSRVLIPIDSKFPHEDYERLLAAQEAGIAELVETAAKSLERAVRLQAKTICDKYVCPPHTTDFAIMYLPTEGLYAEVARRPGLMMDLQNQCRIMVAGPSNLAAFLTSLQMGFRTVAIEKRSSEVWQVLGAAKAEFEKYGTVWDKLVKKLNEATNVAEDAGRRTRAVARKLRDVQVIEGAPQLIAIEGGLADDDDSDAGAA